MLNFKKINVCLKNMRGIPENHQNKTQTSLMSKTQTVPKQIQK